MLDQALLDAVPAALTFEDNGKQVPYKDHPFVKEAPDFATFLKGAVDAHREVGARVPLKIDRNDPTSIEKWRKDQLPRLYDAGVLAKPPGSIDDYNDVTVRPATLPDGFGWSEDLTKEFKGIALKYGIPKSAVPELLALHQKTIMGVSEVLKTTEEAAMVSLKQEFGSEFESRMESAKRLTDFIVRTPEEAEFFDRTKLGNSPTLLRVLMRLAPLAQADSSFFTTQGSNSSGGASSMTQEQILAEHAAVMSDPKHAHYEGYKRNDKAAMEYIDQLYQKGPNAGKKVELT